VRCAHGIPRDRLLNDYRLGYSRGRKPAVRRRSSSSPPTSCTRATSAGAPSADREALTAVIARVGDLALALADDLESLEVNPLLATGARIEALDAVVTWKEHG
jgi:succinyl-CoA synthetase beta subunit